MVASALIIFLPFAAELLKLAPDEAIYLGLKENLDVARRDTDELILAGDIADTWEPEEDKGKFTDEITRSYRYDGSILPYGRPDEARGAILRELQAMLKGKDPGFGGLIRVKTRMNIFLWVHPRFEKEYNLDPPVFRNQ